MSIVNNNNRPFKTTGKTVSVLRKAALAKSKRPGKTGFKNKTDSRIVLAAVGLIVAVSVALGLYFLQRGRINFQLEDAASSQVAGPDQDSVTGAADPEAAPNLNLKYRSAVNIYLGMMGDDAPAAPGANAAEFWSETKEYLVRRAEEKRNELFDIALSHYYGRGVKQDYVQAAKVFRMAADKGEARAQYLLGRCFFDGEGVSGNHAEAVKWFRLAAKQGLIPAQYDLGWCYYAGTGVEQNYVEAAEWFLLAAKQGYAAAQNDLGTCYLDGYGVEQNYAEAVRWFQLAAKQGKVAAYYNLGLCYERGGWGVKQNHAVAVKWYQLAAKHGHAPSINKLKMFR